MKNHFEIRGDVAVIFLRRKTGEVLETMIDVQDLPIAQSNPYTWYPKYNRRSGSFYVYTNRYEGKKQVLLHRLIMSPPKGMHVDHINHNTLDNRRSNLRIVNNAENHQDIRLSYGDGYRGVSFHRATGKWRARVHYLKRDYCFGYFDSAEEAALFAQAGRAVLMRYSKEARSNILHNLPSWIVSYVIRKVKELSQRTHDGEEVQTKSKEPHFVREPFCIAKQE